MGQVEVGWYTQRLGENSMAMYAWAGCLSRAISLILNAMVT